MVAVEQAELYRLLCTSYGIDCSNLLSEMVAKEDAAIRETQLISLINSLARGISTREGNLRLALPELNPLTLPRLPSAQGVDLLDLLTQQMQRQPRAAEKVNELREGFKRVAFTPRIGR